MRKFSLAALLALTCLAQCTSVKKASPSVYVNSPQLNGRSFQKLFVEVETVDIELRTRLETDIVEALTSKGYTGVKSLDQIPFSLKELRMPTEEEIKQKAKESGCDGILLISLSRNGETVVYTPGTESKKNDQFGAGVLGAALNKGGAEIKTIPAVNTPGSFSHTPAGFIFRSQVFDLPAAQLMFAVQSERIDISALQKNSRDFAAALVEQMKKEKLLK